MKVYKVKSTNEDLKSFSLAVSGYDGLPDGSYTLSDFFEHGDLVELDLHPITPECLTFVFCLQRGGGVLDSDRAAIPAKFFELA